MVASSPQRPGPLAEGHSAYFDPKQLKDLKLPTKLRTQLLERLLEDALRVTASPISSVTAVPNSVDICATSKCPMGLRELRSCRWTFFRTYIVDVQESYTQAKLSLSRVHPCFGACVSHLGFLSDRRFCSAARLAWTSPHEQ